MAKSFFTIDEISQIVNGKGASLLPKKEVKEKEPLAERDELLKMVFGGSILPSETLQDSALQLDQALASNKHLNNLRTATAVAEIVGDAAVEAVGIAEESYNNINGENALAKKISKRPIERLVGTDNNAFGSEGKKRILAALGIDEEDTREVEVEGGEIIENEDGTTQKVEGPKHEQGGVDAMIDDDATVYSDRLQSLIGASKVEKTAKSIAEEKEKRDAKALSLQKKLEKNPNDRLLANTLALTLQQNMIADQIDLMWQKIARMGLEEQAGGKEQLMNAMFNKQDKTESEESEKQQEPQTEEEQQEPEANVEQEPQPEEEQQEQYVFGVVPDIDPPTEETPEKEETPAEKAAREEKEKTERIQAIAGGVGDMLGNQLYTTGAIISGLGGLNTTLQQRSEDILHENKYKGLARGVDKLYEQSTSNISNVTNKRLQELLNETQATKQSIGNNFQSISNVAAYNAMLDDALSKELAKIRGEELNTITSVQDSRAKTLMTNMQKEMEGQGIAEALNDADRDAFYNALHLDYANIGTQMQAVGSQQTDKYKDKTDIKRLLEELKKMMDEEETEDGNDGKGSKGAQGTGTPPESPDQPAAPSTVTTTPASTSAQPEAANTGIGNQTNQATATEVTQSNKEEQIKIEDIDAILGKFNILQYLKQNQTADANAGTGTTTPLLTQTADANAEEETTPQESAQAEVANEENLTDELFDTLFRLAIYAEENGYELSDDLKAIAKKGKEKRDAAKKEEEKTEAAENNNKEDNSGIVTQQETQEHKPKVAPTTEAAVPQEKENEQKKKEAKPQVNVTNEDIETFTEYIEMIKKGKYRESYITDLLDMYKSYMNSDINYLEGDISEAKKKQFTETLSEAGKLMEKYKIDIKNYSPIKKEAGEKYTDILLFNSSGDAKSTFEGTIDGKQSKEITQDELLTLMENIDTEDDYSSESYITPSFANVDIYDKKRYPLSTLKAYRASLDLSDSEKKFLDELIKRREFVDDAIENGKIPVTENTLLKLDLAREAYMPWLKKNPSLQIDANNISYLGHISKDFINEYEANKNNLVFISDKIKTDFNYAIDQIKDLYESNDTELKEFKERMKMRNENIKIAEEQGQIIYEKEYPFYIDMYKINQEPIYYNTKENLIKLKKTITDIIDDYEKNKDKFYYPDDLGNNSANGKESHYKDIMSLKNKMNQIEEKLESFEQKEQTE